MNDLHLPWTNQELEDLLLKVIQTGETDKVDFKRQLMLDTAAAKSELVKDIVSIANTHSRAYQNHGFIVIGVDNSTLSCTTFGQSSDGLQATIDALIRNNVGPFVPTQLRFFGPDDKRWAVLVVPPSHALPHTLIRDMAGRTRGDIYVRRGTITEKADPNDFARFFRTHMEDATHELKESVRSLQRDLANVRKELKTLGKRASKTAARKEPSVDASIANQPGAPSLAGANQQTQKPEDLLDVVDSMLAAHVDPVFRGLIDEAIWLKKFLNSDAIPWDLNNLSREHGPAFVDLIEKKAETFWLALARLVARDSTGKYDDAIVDAISHLAYEADPVGRSFTSFGIGLRLYPLVMSVYIVFVLGAARKRHKLLQRIAGITIARKSYHDDPFPLGSVLFSIRRADEVFQTRRSDYPDRKWCDGVASSVNDWFDRHIFAEGSGWDRDRHFFYVGEFTLCLLPAATPSIGHPSSGLFLFMSESQPVIDRFLRSDKVLLKTLFDSRLKDVLTVFDNTAPRLANSSRCWGDGFSSGAVAAAFGEQTR